MIVRAWDRREILSKSSDTIQYSMTGGERVQQSEEH